MTSSDLNTAAAAVYECMRAAWAHYYHVERHSKCKQAGAKFMCSPAASNNNLSLSPVC
jgi:hypothetical protein